MKTVVVVDDELITRIDFAQRMEEMGFTVIGQAEDGFDAVELCRARRPDLVLMDLRMPVFDGFSASERLIREDLADSILVISAYSDRETMEKAIEAGVNGYLVKPVEQSALFAAVQVALAERARRNTLRQRIEALEEELRTMKLVDKAKSVLAASAGTTESEAYRRMQKLAMDKRCSMGVIAQHLLEADHTEDDMVAAKRLLMERHGISEKAAYKRILKKAEEEGCTPARAAAIIRERGDAL